MNNSYLNIMLLIMLITLGGCQGDDLNSSGGSDSQSRCGDQCFPNGIAAGDVDQSSVVLWARANFTGTGTVRFEYGRDPNFVQTPDGTIDIVVENSDIPAKVDVSGLLAGTQYYYRACRDSCPPIFAAESEARGSFRTLHADGKNGLRFGVSSCFRGDMKPFVSIKNVPERDLDFFVALGDTVYADTRDDTGSQAIEPDQFRNKHELAYSPLNSPDDNMFALARASTAFYVGIDDHEVVDDFAGGAKPSSHEISPKCLAGDDARCQSFCKPGDAEYNQDHCEFNFINETGLYKNALDAWHEYNPIRKESYLDTGEARTRGKNKLYRHRTFGKDAAMFMLDTRSFRDSASLDVYNPGRTMLGNVQLEDLKRDLLAAENKEITWKFIMVPEPMQQLLPDPVTALDRFEGYGHERNIILDFIETNCIANVVFISGDIHANIVNNLIYSDNDTGIKRYSTAWDISTGPAAYEIPTAATKLFSNSDAGEPYEPLDRLFQDRMDTGLLAAGRPRTGLDPELIPSSGTQLQNRNVPARLINGSYVAGHSYGWTEFEVDSTTQKLVVTTYGVDWYKNPNQISLNNQEYAAEVLNRNHYILHRFEVSPRYGCPGCGDAICDASFPLYEKCGGDDTTLLQCRSDCGQCGNGDLCGDDAMCESGLCNVGICMSPQDNGSPCVRDKGCISDICSGGFCVSPKANGSVCLRDKVCQSGLCDFGICTAPNSKGRFSPCESDRACRSGNCTAAFICGL